MTTAFLRRTFIAASLVLVLAPVLARADGSWRTASPESQGMSSKELANLVTFGVDNGMDSLLVVRHGRIVAEAYYAPFPAGTRHRINSATKSVIGTLVGIAVKEGLIRNLDQPVLDFFPGRAFAKVDDRKKAITLRHLLDMTSGLDWNEPLGNSMPWSFLEMERSPDWVQNILDHAMAREPGLAFDYNSGNPHLLSAILSKVTGRSAFDYAREKLLGPLGIDDVYWRQDPQGVTAGGAGLYLQPRDMAKLGQFWMQDGVWEGRRLLPEGWIEQARHAKVDMGLPGLRYGNLFWSAPPKDAFMAVGFHRQLIVMLPAQDLVAVFTGASRYANASGVPSAPNYGLSVLIDRLKAAVKSDAALPEDVEALPLLAERIKAVAREARTQPAGSSPLAAAISGKVYRLLPNDLRIDSYSLTFDKAAAAYGYEFGGKLLGGPVGLDGYYAVGGRRLFGTGAAKGRWLDDRTFQLDFQTIGNDDAALATFTFDGKAVEVSIKTLFGINFLLKGEAGE